jgi:proliferating cell nuclear antigen
MSVVVKGEILKTISKAVAGIVSDCRIHFTPDKLYIRAVDPSNVAMVTVDVPKESFEEYNIQSEQVYGVDVQRIAEISKIINANDNVTLDFTDGYMHVRTGTMEYSIALIDPEAIRKEPKTPELKLPAKITLSADRFKKALEAADKIADNVLLKKTQDSFQIIARGDTEKITISLSPTELIEFTGEGEAKSLFNLEFVKEFFKITDSTTPATIELGTNYPAIFSFLLNKGKVQVKYFLAPRIEEDTD